MATHQKNKKNIEIFLEVSKFNFQNLLYNLHKGFLTVQLCFSSNIEQVKALTVNLFSR